MHIAYDTRLFDLQSKNGAAHAGKKNGAEGRMMVCKKNVTIVIAIPVDE